MAIDVSVTNIEPFNETIENAFLDITFTNTSSFTYAAGNIYYYALLTDSSDPELTQEVTFKVTHATGGTVDEDTSETFTIENTNNLVAPIAGTDGRILYNAV
ncbi:MAG: hypothetical protein PHF89_03130 [Eubacteriales bacterium]|jgi:hypothetical protein|nr:hypothetical protein [Eubacteriales bacterium]